MKQHAAHPLPIDLYGCLHLDRWGEERVRIAPSQGTTVAVVAGDLHRNPALAVEALKTFRARYAHVVYVEGNNEFRDPILTDGNFNLADTVNRLSQGIENLNKTPGGHVHYLAHGPVVIKNVAFAGRNTHWDYAVDPRISVAEAIAQQAVRANAAMGLVDISALSGQQRKDAEEQIRKQAFNTPAKGARRTDPISLKEASQNRRQGLQDLRDLKREIAELDNLKEIKDICLVTHTVPHIAGTPLLDFKRKDGQDWSPLVMSTMANSGTGALALESPKISHHFFAHAHGGKDLIVTDKAGRDVRYTSNPCGDPGQNHAAGGLGDYTPLRVLIGAPHPARLNRHHRR